MIILLWILSTMLWNQHRLEAQGIMEVAKEAIQETEIVNLKEMDKEEADLREGMTIQDETVIVTKIDKTVVAMTKIETTTAATPIKTTAEATTNLLTAIKNQTQEKRIAIEATDDLDLSQQMTTKGRITIEEMIGRMIAKKGKSQRIKNRQDRSK